MKGGDNMSEKFLGVGLVNVFGIFLMVTIFSLISKVVLTKYPISGLSEIVQAS